MPICRGEIKDYLSFFLGTYCPSSKQGYFALAFCY